MTRKHFEAIATALNAQWESLSGQQEIDVFAETFGRLLVVFKESNPNFDAVRFTKAVYGV